MQSAFPRDFGRYRLTGLLGAGGMAEVYRAQTRDEPPREVALKRIPRDRGSDPEADRTVLDEARIWGRLKHPNVVTMLDFGEHEGDWFLALELVEGLSLADLLKGIDALPVAEALYVVERLARGLAHAHEAADENGTPLEIVHRDVKPANILVSKDGEVKLTDFGIARAADRLSQTRAGEVKGSIYFLSPEHARGDEVDGRSDLFSLGAVFHVMLTGSALIDLPEAHLFTALEEGRVPPPPDGFPPAVRELLATLTAAEPVHRARNARAVVDHIAAFRPEGMVEDGGRQLARRVREAVAGGASAISSAVELSGTFLSVGRSVDEDSTLPGDAVGGQGDESTLGGAVADDPEDERTRISDPIPSRPVGTSFGSRTLRSGSTGERISARAAAHQAGGPDEPSITIDLSVTRSRREEGPKGSTPDSADEQTTTGRQTSTDRLEVAVEEPFADPERTHISGRRIVPIGSVHPSTGQISGTGRLPSSLRPTWGVLLGLVLAAGILALLGAGPLYRFIFGS